MKTKSTIKELKKGHTEQITVRRYANGEFMITSEYSYSNKEELSYVSPEAFQLMKELEKSQEKKK